MRRFRHLQYVLLGTLVVLSLAACKGPERVSGGAWTVETPAGWTSEVPAVKTDKSVDFVFTRVRETLPATLTVVVAPGQRGDKDLLRRINKSISKKDQRAVSQAVLGDYSGYQWQSLTASETAYQFFGAGAGRSVTVLVDSRSGDGKDADAKWLAKVLSTIATAPAGGK